MADQHGTSNLLGLQVLGHEELEQRMDEVVPKARELMGGGDFDLVVLSVPRGYGQAYAGFTMEAFQAVREPGDLGKGDA